MELDWLRSFLVLAGRGNMTRAAEELRLTQPAVSGQLARLEGELGTALFDRTPRGMQLTEPGRTFRAYAEEVLARLEDGRQALSELRGLERGTLRIGGGATATTFLLPPLLGRFHERYPGIRLFVREQGSKAVVEAVVSGELDLGVVTLPVSAPEGVRLAREPWLTDEMLLIVPPGHRLARKRSFRWRELAEQPMVLFEAGSAVRELIDQELARAGIAVQIAMELRSIESIKQMVAQGIGAAFVSRFALEAPARGGRPRGLACADGRLQRDLALVYRSDRTPRAAARAFLELLRTPRR